MKNYISCVLSITTKFIKGLRHFVQSEKRVYPRTTKIDLRHVITNLRGLPLRNSYFAFPINDKSENVKT